EKDRIYRARVRLSSSVTSPLRLNSSSVVRFGNPLTTGVSNTWFVSTEIYTDQPGGRTSPNYPGASATQVDCYLATMGAGTLELSMEIIDQSTMPLSAFDLRISGYEISSTTREELGAATILANLGGPV